MRGKYKKGNFLWIRFDLTGDKELPEAYGLFCGGFKAVEPYVSEKTKEEMADIAAALHRDAILYNERVQTATKFNICSKCGHEIDLTLKSSYKVDETYPDMQIYCHVLCPPRRDVYRRDL